MVTGLDRPNGLAFSPDEQVLFVSNTSLSDTPAIHAFAVAKDGRTVGEDRVFAVSEAGFFDGFRLDRAGNLWTSSGDGVRVYAADGTLLGRINIPETVSNLCFGGPKRNRLYITATSSLYAVYVYATSADRPLSSS